MSLQGPVIKWVAIHRRHHQQSDRNGDPHSPHLHGHSGLRGLLIGMWHSHMGWLFDPDPVDISRSVNDLLTDPTTSSVDRLFWLWVILQTPPPRRLRFRDHTTHAWGMSTARFIWGGLARICVMHHATFSINSVCRVWGAAAYQSNDESRNNPICGIVCFDEGWHNLQPPHLPHLRPPRPGLSGKSAYRMVPHQSPRNHQDSHWDVRLPSKAAMNAKRPSRAIV